MTDARHVVDAYSHVGVPRFVSPEAALDVCERAGIAKAVCCLGPGTPDIVPLANAVRERPDRVRAVGIPFGATPAQRLDLVGLQLDAGFSGIRLGQNEFRRDPAVENAIGERGRWIFYAGWIGTGARAAGLLAWLERHPRGRVAVPHCLHGAALDLAATDTRIVRDLLEHERFHVILSRQGDGRSRQRYPYRDLLPWVRMLATHCGWQRIMWGSEHPVLHWRDETIARCLSWVTDAGVDASDDEFAAYFGGNAERLFFAEPPPAARGVELPAWVEEQFDRTRPLSLFQNATVTMPMDKFEPLMTAYLRESEGGTKFTFGKFIARRLARR